MSRSFMTGLATLVVGLLFAAIFFLMARFYKEAALILADIGDSIVVDSNSRARQGFSAGAGIKSAQAANRGARGKRNSADLATIGESVVRVFLRSAQAADRGTRGKRRTRRTWP